MAIIIREEVKIKYFNQGLNKKENEKIQAEATF